VCEAFTTFQEARAAAEFARAALVSREAELEAELADIKVLLGRKPRAPKATVTKEARHERGRRARRKRRGAG
jgi:hypothetical protein